MRTGNYKPFIDSHIEMDKELFCKEQERFLLYYIYPKTKDFQKVFLIVIGIWWGYCVNTSGFEGRDAIAAFVCIELLLYAARYQWNDILGFWECVETVPESECITVRNVDKYRGFTIGTR